MRIFLSVFISLSLLWKPEVRAFFNRIRARWRYWTTCGSFAFLLAPPLFADGSAGSSGSFEPRFLVDVPTAGMLARGTFAMDVDFYDPGGVLLWLSAGVLDQFNFGISYGGARLIGGDKPIWNELPGVHIKIRILDESVAAPAIAVGFDSQGRESYVRELDRYTIKSPGFFATTSKNFAVLGYLSIHGGLNYSLERADGDKDINAFAGIEKTLGGSISIMLEYGFGFNDSSGDALGRGKGYLNFGTRWSVGSGFTIGVDLKDIARNQQDTSIGKRGVRLEYLKVL